MKRILAIVGPTATGKTGFAVATARMADGEIVSGDSRQVYCGMDLGTGKDLGEYGEVPYHLIDMVPAGTKYNLFQYLADTDELWRIYRDAESSLCFAAAAVFMWNRCSKGCVCLLYLKIRSCATD